MRAVPWSEQAVSFADVTRLGKGLKDSIIIIGPARQSVGPRVGGGSRAKE